MTRDGDFAVPCDLVVYRETEETAIVGIAIDSQPPKRLTKEARPNSEAITRAAMQICEARAFYGDVDLLLSYHNLADGN